MRTIITTVLILSTSLVFGHGGEKHETIVKDELKSDNPEKSSEYNPSNKKVVFEDINRSYLINVKPIFKNSCFDCHSSEVKLPWYHSIPGVKQLIDQDIKEAKKHLDFSSDFPFTSHDTPVKDLKSIKESVINDEMPPFNYRFMHSEATLKKKDKKTISIWVEKSLEKIK